MNFQSNQMYFAPSGNPYFSFCSSDDFQIVVCGHNSGIWLSYDYGMTWSHMLRISISWRDVCCSSDGKYIYAAGQGDDMYYSNNYGATFTASGQSGTKQWYGCCCSTNGQLVYACVRGGVIWWSNDYGVTWYQLYNTTLTISGTTIDTTMDWTQICCNDSGNILFATTRYPNNGCIYRILLINPSGWTSTPFISTTLFAGSTGGATGPDTNYAGARYFRGLRCNKDGTRVVATIDDIGTTSTADHGLLIFNNNSVYPTSTGWTFTRALSDTTVTSSTPSPANATRGIYIAIGCSRDFKNMITGEYATSGNQYWYYSTDYGITWTMIDNGAYKWHAVYVSDNKFIIGSDDVNKAFIGQFYPNTSFYNIGGASFEQLVASGQSIGPSTGRINTIITKGVYPIYSFAFNNTTGNFDVSSNGMNNTFGFIKGGISTDTAFTYTNPAGSTSIQYNNITTDTRKHLSINNALSYSGTKTDQAYIQQIGYLWMASFSISFWIYPYNVSSANNYISLLNSTNQNSTGCIDIAIDGNNNKVAFVLNNDFSNNKIVCSTALTANSKWYHITATYNACTGYGYLYVTYNDPVNGKIQTSSFKDYGPGVSPSYFSALLIGIRWGFNSSASGYKGFNGLVGNLNIYPRELTFGEVNSIYNAGLNANGLVYSTNVTLNTSYVNNSNIVKGQAWFGDSSFSMIRISNYYKLTNNGMSMTQDSYNGMFAPYYTIYTTGNGTADISFTHTLQSWTNYVLIMCIGGGGGGGGGNFENGGDTGGAGGGGAGGGLSWIVINANVLDDNNLTVKYGSGGTGGDNYWNNYTAVFVGGNGLDGGNSYVNATIGGVSTNLCKAHGGAKAYNKYNNFYNNHAYDETGTDVTYSGTSSTPTAAWPNNYNWYVDEGTVYVKGTPRTTTSATPVSNGGTTTNIKSKQGGNGGINGSIYTGVTDLSGNPITTVNTTTSTGNLFCNNSYKLNTFGGTQLGNNGSNGQDDPGSAAGQGGTGGNSGLYDSSGNYFNINSQILVFDWNGTKFINKQNGTEIISGSSFKFIGKGGDGGDGESSAGNNNQFGFKGNDGAVFIIEYAVLPL